MGLGLWIGAVVLAANVGVVVAGCVLAWRRDHRPRVVVPPAHPRTAERRRRRVA